MESRIWIRLWRRQCERTNFFIGVTIAQDIVIMALVGGLVLALTR